MEKYAKTRIRWKEDGLEENVTIKLSLDIVDAEDDYIFFYCDGLDEYKDILAHGTDEWDVVGCTLYTNEL